MGATCTGCCAARRGGAARWSLIPLYQRPQGMTVAQVLDVIEATRSGSSAKKRHAVQDLSTMSS